MGCASPANGSMRNRLGNTIAFFARNSWKASIVYVVATMPFLRPTSLSGGFSVGRTNRLLICANPGAGFQNRRRFFQTAPGARVYRQQRQPCPDLRDKCHTVTHERDVRTAFHRPPRPPFLWEFALKVSSF